MPSRRRGPRQLALALDQAESFAREDFLQGPSNAAALAMIDRWPDWPAASWRSSVREGRGKSHLAAIWAEEIRRALSSPRAISTASIFRRRSRPARWCWRISRRRFRRGALFHLLNLVQQEGACVLLTARTPPAALDRWRCRISPRGCARCRWSHCRRRTTRLLRAVMVKLFADRQIAVRRKLIAYLLPRIGRSFAGRARGGRPLDREALRRSAPVNRALAAELFRDLES